MSKKKTLKKGGGYYPFDFLERRDNRMSRDGYYLKNPRFNSEVINAYNNKFPDSKRSLNVVVSAICFLLFEF